VRLPQSFGYRRGCRALSGAHKDESQAGKVKRLTEENVLMQLGHMNAVPSVANAMAPGEFTTSGWIYDSRRGVVYIAQEGHREFVSATTAAGTAA
jgi:carbonic anhydrase